MKKSWHEDPKWTNIGMITSGAHCIYDFEVLIDKDGDLAFIDHDESEDQMSLNDIITFDMEHNGPSADTLQRQLVNVLISHGAKP